MHHKPTRVLRSLRNILIVVVAALVGTLVVAPTAQAATPKSTATAKEYKKIKNGQSLKKVRKIIGSKGENVTTGSQPKGSYVYMWRSTGNKDVYVRFANSKVKKKNRIKDRTVSYAEWKKTKNGQSYSKVKSIVRSKAGAAIHFSDGSVQRTWCDANALDYVTGLFYENKLVDGGLHSIPWWDHSWGAPTCPKTVY